MTSKLDAIERKQCGQILIMKILKTAAIQILRKMSKISFENNLFKKVLGE